MARIIRIKAQPHVPGGRFCRAGRCFGTVETDLAEDDLTREQLAALQAEPMLVVEIVDAPEEKKPAKPAAAPKDEAKPAPKADPKPAAAPAADAKAKPAPKDEPKDEPNPAAKEGGK